MTDAAVHCVDLSKSYGEVSAVRGFSLTLDQGETLALLGPSGCGKTTTLRLIAGFEVPDSGEVRIGDTVVSAPGRWLPPERRGVGVVFQDYALFPHLDVWQNVAFGLHRLSKEKRGQRVQEILALVDLVKVADRYPHELSGGQQQRVALARALAPMPLVVLLDEPFSNLHADLRAQMRHEVKRILRASGSTAIIVTHDQEEALTLGDRVAVLQEGQLQQVGPPEQIFHRPATRFVAEFLGIADFLPGELIRQGIRTELGLVRQPVAEGVGRRVDVMVRPHDVVLYPDPGGSSVVVGRRFRGAEYLYTAQLSSGLIVHSTQPHIVNLPIGSRVHVVAEPGHPLIYFDGKGAVER